MVEIKIKPLHIDTIIPTKGYPSDACFDIYAYVNYESQDVVIRPHTTTLIHTGFSTEIPEGYWAAIFARSSVATKYGLRPAQGVPVIDPHYRGEWMIPLHNDTDCTKIIKHGDRIAQFMILPILETSLSVVADLNDTDRGEGGFGSTGK